MKRKIVSSLSVYAVLACLWLPGRAQTGFRYRAPLDSVRQTGFYLISLGPALTARLQPALQDIRIVDSSGRQVPYVLKNEVPVSTDIDVSELRIVSNEKGADGLTQVVIENSTGHSIQQLLLKIKNTAAQRTATLSGSDDNSRWYVIKENVTLNNAFTEVGNKEAGDRYVQSLDFPESRYAYFKISINGKDLLPVNIVGAGTYERANTEGKYRLLPSPKLLNKEGADKYSYLFMRFDDTYFIDRLQLQVAGPAFYKRPITIDTGSIGDAGQEDEHVLQSGTAALFELHVKTNHLLLKIRNDDNPPLLIASVNAFQLRKYLYTYLERGKQYALLYGDSAATAPVYDLQYFKDSIGTALLPLDYGKTEINQPAKTAARVPASSNKWIWIALGAALVVLLLLTAKMTREINKRPS